MTPVLKLSQVSHFYKLDEQNVPVLKKINLTINPGDMVAIQGPSGSGKSTLLYLMGCLLQMQEGLLELDGQDIRDFSEDALAHFRNQKIGFIFQQFHLMPRTTVLENILLPTLYTDDLTSNEVTKERAIQLAQEVGLEDRLEHKPNQLSGGQQQRVAIARALMKDPSLVLADEPTGNLDSKASSQIMNLLKSLNKSGKTIVIITHDAEVAKQCDRIYFIRDGEITGEEKATSPKEAKSTAVVRREKKSIFTPIALRALLKSLRPLLPMAFQNLSRNRVRTVLTMTGITIGIAAVLSMVTLGQFTKEKILAGYAELGVNSLMFNAHKNWDLKATDVVPVMFRFLDWNRDIQPLFRIFPQVEVMSPILYTWWNIRASYGGKVLDSDVRIIGINEHGLGISNRQLLAGKNFSPYHVENHHPVCVIGYEVGQRLFTNLSPIGKILGMSYEKSSFGCLIVGILKETSSNKEWKKPNLEVYVPYTFFQSTSQDWYQSQIRHVLIRLKAGSDIEHTGKEIRSFFEMKYGKSGEFHVDSDSLLLAQMQKFLNLFTLLLGTIAFVALAVGGIGITNMMLVSVSERFREIGLRKTFGATNFNIRMQFLIEAVVICSLAGFFGLLMGFISYESVIFVATKFVKQMNFEWIFNWGAFLLATVSIFVVGILSGFFPALRAERLQVIESLRSE